MVEEIEKEFMQAIITKDILQIKLNILNGFTAELRQNKELVS